MKHKKKGENSYKDNIIALYILIITEPIQRTINMNSATKRHIKLNKLVHPKDKIEKGHE